jgi:hypothetical protein
MRQIIEENEKPNSKPINGFNCATSKLRGYIQYYSTTAIHFKKRVFAKKGLGFDFSDEFQYK